MDPQSLPSRSTAPEIWPFQLAGTQRTAPVGRNSTMQEVGGSRDGSAEESTVTGQSCVGGRNGRRRTKARNAGIPAAVVSEDDSSKLACTSSGNDLIDFDGKRRKAEGSKDENGDSKTDMEENSADFSRPTDQSATPPEAPKQDYIHVRARRGQATDSHSLAERARREKISERMKILQDLVPGCNKVIGKALVLDEIINYIQSLQRQVEFLSMKLEVVNSRMNSIIEEFPAKNFGVVQAFDHPGMPFSSQPEGEYAQAPQEWLHMQVGSSFARVT